MANLIRFALGQRLMMSHRSYAPAWERIRQCSSVANRDAGASLTAFPRRSVGTIRMQCRTRCVPYSASSQAPAWEFSKGSTGAGRGLHPRP